MRIIQTTKGPLPESALERTVGLEDRPDCLALWVEFRALGDATRELVRRDAFRLPKQTERVIQTIAGPMDRGTLRRTLELDDRDAEMVVAEVFRDPTTDALLHRSVAVVLKDPTVAASGVAAAIG